MQSVSFYNVKTRFNDLDTGWRMESNYFVLAYSDEEARIADERMVGDSEQVRRVRLVEVTDQPQLAETSKHTPIPRNALWTYRFKAGWGKAEMLEAATFEGEAGDEHFLRFIKRKFS